MTTYIFCGCSKSTLHFGSSQDPSRGHRPSVLYSASLHDPRESQSLLQEKRGIGLNTQSVTDPSGLATLLHAALASSWRLCTNLQEIFPFFLVENRFLYAIYSNYGLLLPNAISTVKFHRTIRRGVCFLSGTVIVS